VASQQRGGGLELGQLARAGGDQQRGVELRLDGMSGVPDVVRINRGFGRDVPDDLAVLLQKVRIALRVLDDRIHRIGAVRDSQALGRLRESAARLRLGKLPDTGKIEESLGGRLRLAGPTR
jgi:hypothetical protein